MVYPPSVYNKSLLSKSFTVLRKSSQPGLLVQYSPRRLSLDFAVLRLVFSERTRPSVSRCARTTLDASYSTWTSFIEVQLAFSTVEFFSV